MKNLLYSLIFIFQSGLVFSQNYYWGLDQKVPVTIMPNIFSLRYEKDVPVQELAKTMGITVESISSAKRVHEKIWRIDLRKNFSEYSTKSIPGVTIDGSSPVLMTGEISVMPREDTNIELIIEKYNLKLVEKLSYGAYLLATLSPFQTLSIANAIYENENVKWSSPDFLEEKTKMNDPLYPDQYYLKNTGQFGGTPGIDINVEQAWNLTAGCNIRVAVFDDGLETHDDFAGRVATGFTPGFVNSNGAPFSTGRAHGMACAGIIGATHNNTLGIKGVAPNVTLIPIKILENYFGGDFTTTEIATAIDWAVSSAGGNAEILSNSWGYKDTATRSDISFAYTSAMANGRDNKGCIAVFSSGNSTAVQNVFCSLKNRGLYTSKLVFF